MKTSVLLGALGACVFPAAGFGAIMPLTGGNPDVASGFVAVSYNAATHVFSATGFTQSIRNIDPALGNRQFQLTASIDNNGAIIPGGTFSLTVRGDYNSANELLYSSSLLALPNNFTFGATDRFEFVFVQQAGSLAAPGTEVGTILVGNIGTFPGGVPSFLNSFTNAPGGFGAGVADTFAIPTPGAALPLLAGLAVLRRRR